MTAVTSRSTRRSAAPALSVEEAPTTEDVILALLGVVRGFNDKDRGQLTHMVNGVGHLESCQVGMWIQAGDSLRGGQSCSERCQMARLAVAWATAWVMARKPADRIEQPRPTQLTLLGAAIGG